MMKINNMFFELYESCEKNEFEEYIQTLRCYINIDDKRYLMTPNCRVRLLQRHVNNHKFTYKITNSIYEAIRDKGTCNDWDYRLFDTRYPKMILNIEKEFLDIYTVGIKWHLINKSISDISAFINNTDFNDNEKKYIINKVQEDYNKNKHE